MSAIAIGLNLMLAGLLAAALMMGYRLNARLKALRESHEGFAKAVADRLVAGTSPVSGYLGVSSSDSAGSSAGGGCSAPTGSGWRSPPCSSSRRASRAIR